MANIKVIKPKKHHYYPNTGKLHKRADNLLDRDFNQKKVILIGWVILLISRLTKVGVIWLAS